MQIKNNDGQFWIKTEKALDLYRNLSVELFENTVKRLAKRGTVDLQDNPWVWQLEKLNDMHLLNEETVKIISERAGIAEDVFRDVIANEGYRIYQNSHQQLQEALRFNVQGDPQVQASLNALVGQTMGDVNNIINTTLPNSVARTFNKMVADSVAGVVTGMKSQEKAISEAVQKAHQKGFYSFTDRAGRERTVEPHIRTIVKTTAFRTYREMREKPAEEFGIDTFLYSSKSAARELCAPLQNKIVTKGVARVEKGQKVLSLTDYGYGKANGCQGIGCGHYMTPFIIGINEIPKLSDEDNLSEEELIRNANAQAKQRAFEREIRKSKELINISKIVNDKELEQKHRLRVKTLQSGLKQHIEKNPFLYRDKAREKGSRIRSTLPIEQSNNNLNKNTMVARNVINSSEYRAKFEKLGETDRVTRNLYKMSKAILRHRHGTEFEDLVMVNSKTNKTLVRSDYNKPRTVAPTRSQLKMVRENKGKNNIIGIHNHPNSSVPSLSDLNVAYKRGYKYGLVVTHDGTIYKYNSSNLVDPVLYKMEVDTLEKAGYTKGNKEKFFSNLKKLGVEMEEI